MTTSFKCSRTASLCSQTNSREIGATAVAYSLHKSFGDLSRSCGQGPTMIRASLRCHTFGQGTSSFVVIPNTTKQKFKASLDPESYRRKTAIWVAFLRFDHLLLGRLRCFSIDKVFTQSCEASRCVVVAFLVGLGIKPSESKNGIHRLHRLHPAIF